MPTASPIVSARALRALRLTPLVHQHKVKHGARLKANGTSKKTMARSWNLVRRLRAPFIGVVDKLLRPIIFGRDAHLPDYVVIITALAGLTVLGLNILVLEPAIASMILHI